MTCFQSASALLVLVLLSSVLTLNLRIFTPAPDLAGHCTVRPRSGL